MTLSPLPHVSDGSLVSLTCCDLIGNEGGDWVGPIAEQAHQAGNLSLDPLFCDPQSEFLSIHADSPCAPEFNPECGLIGAWPIGCGSSPVSKTSWGKMKAAFRPGSK